MILHHWDTDGICSASLLMDIYGEQRNFTPKIGNYFLDDEDLLALRNEENIIVADMNLANAERLCESASVKIYDHHISERIECAEQINPYLQGKRYPSATLVIYEKHGLPLDHRVVLGMVGDVGKRILEMEQRPLVEKYLRDSGKEFKDLERAAALLDSSYKMFKRDEVLSDVFLANDMEAVLNNGTLQKNEEVLEREIAHLVSGAEDINGIMLLKVRSEHHIISALAREIAWGARKTTLVLNEKSDRDEIYLRSPDMDVSRFITLARDRGYNAGGKREVVGIVLPKGEGRKFFNEITEEIK